MMGWFQKIMPREDRFFDLFDRHAHVVEQASVTLCEILKGGAKVPELCSRLVQQEHEADMIAQEVMLAIRRSFITPFDRGDIRSLMASMDDAIDQMNKTAKAITLYEVRDFDKPMQDLGQTIAQAAKLVAEIVPLLSEMRKNAPRLNVLTEEISKVEEHSDHLHDQGLKELYLGRGKKDAMAFIVGAEIYAHLEKVVDRLEDVAKQVNGIVIEHL